MFWAFVPLSSRNFRALGSVATMLCIRGLFLGLSSASALRMAIPVRTTVGTAATALPRHALVAMAEEAAVGQYALC